jgi:hypothetical protein
MFALPLKADIRLCHQHVRFVPISDIADLTDYLETASAINVGTMSQLGQKRTFGIVQSISASPPKADIT